VQDAIDSHQAAAMRRKRSSFIEIRFSCFPVVGVSPFRRKFLQANVNCQRFHCIPAVLAQNRATSLITFKKFHHNEKNQNARCLQSSQRISERCHDFKFHHNEK